MSEPTEAQRTRWERMYELSQAGLSLSKIAARFKVTRQRVHQLLAKAKRLNGTDRRSP